MTKKPKRCRKLSRAEKLIVHAPPVSNAGAGWRGTGADPVRAEQVRDPSGPSRR